MRKQIIGPARHEGELDAESWLPLDDIAEVQVSSENAAHPIESALLPGRSSGWRAEGFGKQTIRLLFKQPKSLRRIALKFVERDVDRAQEYVLRWLPDGERSFREVVRQQWNFSPRGSTEEIEDHRVDLPAVTALELSIIPDRSGKPAVASLAQLRIV